MRRLTYEEVKHFVEVKSGSGCKLLSEEYFNSDSKIIITVNHITSEIRT